MKKDKIKILYDEYYDDRFSEDDIHELQDNEEGIGYVSPLEANRYDRRFSGKDVVRLAEGYVPNEEAIKYHHRFSGEEIWFMYKSNISAQDAGRFDEDFSGFAIAHMSRAGITPHAANTLKKRFGSIELWTYAEDLSDELSMIMDFRDWGIEHPHSSEKLVEEISGIINTHAEELTAYNQRFKINEAVALRYKGVTPNKANEYLENHDLESIIYMHEREIQPKTMEKINLILPGKTLEEIIQKKIPYQQLINTKMFGTEEAESVKKISMTPEDYAYNQRFTLEEIKRMRKKAITPQQADEYKKELRGAEILSLAERGIDGRLANAYKESDYYDIIEFHEAGIEPELANTYLPRRHNARGLVELIKAGVSPKDLSIGRESFFIDDFKKFKEKGIPIQRANQYDERMKGDDIIYCWENGVDPRETKKYHESIKNVGFCIRHDVDPEAAIKTIRAYGWKAFEFSREYDRDIQEVMKMLDLFRAREKKYHSPETDNSKRSKDDADEQYHYDFIREGRVKDMLQHGISFEEAKTSRQRVRKELEDLTGIDEEIYQAKDKEALALAVNAVRNSQGVKEHPELVHIIGAGKIGVVVFDKLIPACMKYAKSLERENKMFDLLEGKETRNIIKRKHAVYGSGIQTMENYRGWTKEVDILEIENIRGDSLENNIKKKKFLPEETLRYGADIMNGLIELRKAGIMYHNDLRPANIMIDEERDKAVIIDLGQATTSRYKPHLENVNRRYGGPNDLTSLGQIMYKMATGAHLFAKSRSMDITLDSGKIKDHREWVYEKQERLREYLQKIDDNIHHQPLASTIKKLLTAKDYHYMNLQRHFQLTIAGMS